MCRIFFLHFSSTNRAALVIVYLVYVKCIYARFTDNKRKIHKHVQRVKKNERRRLRSIYIRRNKQLGAERQFH